MSYAAAAMAVFQVFSAEQNSEMMRKEGEFNQKVALVNSQYAEQDAWEAEQFGYSRVGRYKATEDHILGEQMGAFASQGIDFTFGTASEILEETKLNAYLNTLDIQKQARANALDLKIQASNIRMGGKMQAAQANANAKTTQRQGLIAAGGTVANYYAGRS